MLNKDILCWQNINTAYIFVKLRIKKCEDIVKLMKANNWH